MSGYQVLFFFQLIAFGVSAFNQIAFKASLTKGSISFHTSFGLGLIIQILLTNFQTVSATFISFNNSSLS